MTSTQTSREVTTAITLKAWCFQLDFTAAAAKPTAFSHTSVG